MSMDLRHHDEDSGRAVAGPVDGGGGARRSARAACAEEAARVVTEWEKYGYAQAHAAPFAVLGLISSVLLLIGLSRFAGTREVLLFAVPFVLLNGAYLLLSYGVMLCGRSFSLSAHRARVARAAAGGDGAGISVDVFLPICGEDREVVLTTWRGVQELDWPGPLNVYVLDDSPTDGFRRDAAQFGFHYLRRRTREFKKAGNLRHGFRHSQGEFILLLDADFRPRPDMLRELAPYLLEDPRLAIVQSPQYFDVDERMGWIEAGAGYVQELFYRLIQTARDRWDAAVCVGSCALYRRAALATIGGTVPIEHSEDMWTAFELMVQGWKVRYVPVVLAKGTCPDTVRTFFTQQYRWCCGSLSLVGTRLFWHSPLTAAQKACFVSGLLYYVATAVNVLAAPLPPLIMVWCFPHLVHWNQQAYTILALLNATAMLAIWSRYAYGFHYLSCRELSAASHLVAVWDAVRGRRMSWVVTGARGGGRDRRVLAGLTCLLAVSGGAMVLVWYFAVQAVRATPDRWIHFVPPVAYSTLQGLLCWRTVFPRRDLTAPVRERVAAWWRSVQALAPWLGRPRLPQPVPRLVACLLLLLGANILAWSYGAAMPESGEVERASPRSGDTPVPQLAARAVPPHRITTPGINRVYRPNTTATRAELSPWTVVDAFPGTAAEDGLTRVVRLRQHPTDPQTYYVADFLGAIREVVQTADGWSTSTLLDLTGGDLEWLLSFDLHPQYPHVRKAYVFYRTLKDQPRQWYRVSAVDLQETPATQAAETVLIEQELAHEEHVGADLAFDDQGFLLVGVGDNARSNNDVNSQKIDQGLFAGILRIDVDCRGGGVSHPPPRQPVGGRTAGYYIPGDNPFVGVAGALEEFWALGLRNPFRIHFDSARDGLWIGEVGQDRREQVEFAARGTNHGWSFREGTLFYERSHLQGRPPQPLSGRLVDPVFEYPHEDLDFCVIGGVVYLGDKFPELQGRYVFGDYKSGRIWTLDPERPAARELLLQLPFTLESASLVSISTDRQGNLLFICYNSWPNVYRLERSERLQLPATLSGTGLFADVRTLAPAEGTVPYDVTVPLWSDGLQKRRWMRLPPGARIDNRDTRWQFPPGTILIKHFEQPLSALPGAPRTNVETRVLVVKDDGRVAGATYRWQPDGADAVLQLERQTLTLARPGPSHGFDPSEFAYRLPGFRDCVVCHNRENPVLGVNPLQLQRRIAHDGRPQEQLLVLSAQGLFEQPYTPEGVAALPSLTPLDDAAADIERRARSYLHANCSFCHFPRGIRDVPALDLRLTTPLEDAALVAAPSQFAFLEIDGRVAPQVIAPGKPDDSALIRRMRSHDRNVSMPYLGRTRVDEQALLVLQEWIRSLPEQHPREPPAPER